MDGKEFSNIRHYLGQTQEQLARLLCVSSKAIQSFEQGWRNIPTNIERQLLFLAAAKNSFEGKPCWEVTKCRWEWKRNCIAWQYKTAHFCWFITGTYCHGQLQSNWQEKIKLCRQCEVFKTSFAAVKDEPVAKR